MIRVGRDHGATKPTTKQRELRGPMSKVGQDSCEMRGANNAALRDCCDFRYALITRAIT